MKITNITNGPKGVNAVSGPVFLEPGETIDVEISKGEVASSTRMGWFSFGDADAPVDDGSAPKTPAEVLALFDDDATHFMTAKAEATKLLGDKTPATKDDIIAALKAI